MSEFSCKKCKHDTGKCRGSNRQGSHKNCFEPKSMTNADRMNAMSIEEKAAFIVDEVLDIKHEGMRETAYGAWLKWLQQPCGGADNG